MTRVRERRLRPARAAARASARAEAEIRDAGARAARARAARRARRPLSAPALGRPAPARRARARARRRAASVLLLDEPFGALDAKVRQELRRWLRRLHDEIARHQRLRHARPGGGARGRRPRRGDEPRPHRAGRHARRGLRPAGDAVRLRASSATSTCSTAASTRGRTSSTCSARLRSKALIPAKVEYIAPRGAVVRVELTASAANGTLEVELTREQQSSLASGCRGGGLPAAPSVAGLRPSREKVARLFRRAFRSARRSAR